MSVPFDPIGASRRTSKEPRWINVDGNPIEMTTPHPSAEDVWLNGFDFDIRWIPLRDPDYFVPGGPFVCREFWKVILRDYEHADFIWDVIDHGLDVEKMFCPFVGEFCGRHYDSPRPVCFYRPNATTCRNFGDVIARTLEKRIINGSMLLLGRIEDIPVELLPICIMPLTVEPCKPRVCHNCQFINCWIRDNPFKLDTLKDAMRLVGEDTFMIKTDDSNGYDHIKLTSNSFQYLGLQWGGYIFVYATLAFGLKCSPFCYQTVGMALTSYMRNMGISNLQYIDDRLAMASNRQMARKVAYVLLELASRLGWTLGLKKCVLEPQSVLKWLGLIIDAPRQTFVVPEDKKISFRNLREEILSANHYVDLKTLQRFVGKCVSFILAVPAAKLYIREANWAIGACARKGYGSRIHLSDNLKKEIEHWSFLDVFSGPFPWRLERHMAMEIITDSSLSGYAAVRMDGQIVTRGYWEGSDMSPIHVREAEAVYKGLCALGDEISHLYVDVFVDNMAVLLAWNSEGGRDPKLNDVLKRLFELTVRRNCTVRMKYVASSENLADGPSRILSKLDTRLDRDKWKQIDMKFGPHTIDLMASDENVMCDGSGNRLRFFSEYPSALSSGVNVFAQILCKEVNPYVFPPFGMIAPLLNYLVDQNVVRCTLVIPVYSPRPSWWPTMLQMAKDYYLLGKRGEKGVLWYPGPKGYEADRIGLKYDLWAIRCEREV